MRVIYGKGAVRESVLGKLKILAPHPAKTNGYLGKDRELYLFRQSVAKAKKEYSELEAQASGKLGSSEAGIFRIYGVMLEDEDFLTETESLIKAGNSAVGAIKESAKSLALLMKNTGSEYMSERAADIYSVSEKLISIIEGEDDRISLTEPVILACRDLSPAQTVSLNRNFVLGFVTSEGGVNSHTAILAKAMNIPAVVGIGSLPTDADGKTVILDGEAGMLIIDPDPVTESRYRRKTADALEERSRLEKLSSVKVTVGGKRISVCSNIGKPEDVKDVLKNGSDGIGLYRTEFLFMHGSEAPSEAEQFEAYKNVTERMSNAETVIRTLDIGADKQVPYLNLKNEPNPALGLRGIRFCIKYEDIFKTQLRAIMRSSVYGKVSIMLPMIDTVNEVVHAKRILYSVKDELRSEGIRFSPDVKLGIMIETPAAVLSSRELAKEVEFFSVGTNDLIQYTMAADRQNVDVSYLCDGMPESVRRMLEITGKNASDAGIPAGICGELASDTRYTETFINFGFTKLSVSPPLVPKIKDSLLSLDKRSHELTGIRTKI